MCERVTQHLHAGLPQAVPDPDPGGRGLIPLLRRSRVVVLLAEGLAEFEVGVLVFEFGSCAALAPVAVFAVAVVVPASAVGADDLHI